MVAGQYQQAIGVLRQAVAAASPSSLTYAYALYDLGHSLRLAGDPAAAVPILRQRLQIPNQTAVVQQELNLALAAIRSRFTTGEQRHGPSQWPGAASSPGPGNGAATWHHGAARPRRRPAPPLLSLRYLRVTVKLSFFDALPFVAVAFTTADSSPPPARAGAA